MTCLFAFLLLLVQWASGGSAQVEVCESTSCGGGDIMFPFGLKGAKQGPRCSYPKFQVSCDEKSQTILTLPQSGNLVVKSINYEDQTIQVNDPNHCLPKRFLHNLSLSGSPFNYDLSVYGLYNLTFLRCPSNITDTYPLPPISCLGDPTNSSSSVIYAWSRLLPEPLSQWCDVVSSVMFPISNAGTWPFWPDLTDDLQLTWTEPNCGDCEAQGQDCGFARDRGLLVRCFSRPQKESSGLPRSAKYGLAIGVGIPGMLCLIGLSCFMCGKVRMYGQRRQPRPSIELPTSVVLQSGPFMMGLDGSTIEKYPKTLLGESGRLPKPNDNTCPICLSEYQPKETLRTIPDCNHYFHARCVDEWLKMNATCPVCRNSPTLTPASTSSFLSPSSSLSSSP